MAGTGAAQTPTTSALSILDEAPTVKIPAPGSQPISTPQPRMAPSVGIPTRGPDYIPQGGIRPVYTPSAPPVYTPSAPPNVPGSLGGGPVVRPNYVPPSNPAPYVRVTPVPPPPGYRGQSITEEPSVPTEPEEEKSKPGFFRSMINVIPFVGDEEEEPEEESTPAPEVRKSVPVRSVPIPGSDQTLLYPADRNLGPLATPIPSPIPLTPEPVITDPAPLSNTPASAVGVLTVRTEATTQTAAIVDLDAASTAATVKLPAVADAPLQPVPTVMVTPEVPVVTEPSTVSEITLLDSDLGMPNPAYEQNDTVLKEFQDAVKLARDNQHGVAATRFRNYAAQHPGSGLAPRALFLAVILEADDAVAKKSADILKALFPDSRYVGDLTRRRPSIFSSTPVSSVSDLETTAAKIARLESKLTEMVGNTADDVPARLELAELYLGQDQHSRALMIITPIVEQVKGMPNEGPVLVMQAECLLAMGRSTEAAAILMDVTERFPDESKRPRASWNIGLVYEDAGKYEKARAVYTYIQQTYPDTREARWAMNRMRDIERLSN